MFVEEIEHPALTDDSWQSADNYSPHSNCIDELEIDINNPAGHSVKTSCPVARRDG